MSGVHYLYMPFIFPRFDGQLRNVGRNKRNSERYLAIVRGYYRSQQTIVT
jgi:hypothetical protein